jgi:hypothetical protein
MKMPVKVFISYSSADRSEALEVRRLLAHHGCTVWLDVFDIRVAADLKSELGEGIGNADVLCLLLSPTAVLSPWVVEEIERGEEQAASRGMRFVTVLLRPCRPPDTLVGRVMLDATAGISAPDVRARLARAVLGAGVVGDMEIDSAMQASLQAAQHEMEAALVLPELAAQLDPVRDFPIRRLRISFRHGALPHDKALAVSFTFDPLFSQPMWFLFAHYREGRTWPRWMKTMQERDHHEIRSDGARIDGRFEWFDHLRVLDPEIDGTDLRDLPVAFNLELSGEPWRPGGAIASYQGGPTVPHLEQKMEVPSLADLVKKGACFALALLAPEEGSQQAVALEENDLDVRIVGTAGDQSITLFRSAHRPVERAALRGAFLQNRKSQVEREAILGLYARPRELAHAARSRRREDAFALLEKPENALSPDERRVVGLLRYGRARLAMFRVFSSAPPPGPAREDLHRSALAECMAVCRILGPVAEQDPRIDDVGMTFWAASSLANYYMKGGAADRAVPYAEAAVGLVERAAHADPDEAEYQRWRASGLARLAEAEAAAGDHAAAAANLAASIDILQALHEALPVDGRRRDLRQAVESALEMCERWPTVSAAERQRWVEQLNALS